jgi:hypothetical protein
MVSDIRSLNANIYHSMVSTGVGTGKLYVSVKPNQVLYAQFEHVSGIASSGSGSGVPVSKIQILNSLIERLAKVKNDPVQPELPGDLSDEQVDAMIEGFQNQITTAVQTAQANPFALTGLTAPTGQLVNMVA